MTSSSKILIIDKKASFCNLFSCHFLFLFFYNMQLIASVLWIFSVNNYLDVIFVMDFLLYVMQDLHHYIYTSSVLSVSCPVCLPLQMMIQLVLL